MLLLRETGLLLQNEIIVRKPIDTVRQSHVFSFLRPRLVVLSLGLTLCTPVNSENLSSNLQ